MHIDRTIHFSSLDKYGVCAQNREKNCLNYGIRICLKFKGFSKLIMLSTCVTNCHPRGYRIACKKHVLMILFTNKIKKKKLTAKTSIKLTLFPIQFYYILLFLFFAHTRLIWYIFICFIVYTSDLLFLA